MPGNHALVFGKNTHAHTQSLALSPHSADQVSRLFCKGASGITGWAITRLILEGYPTADTFDSVTALTNRPLTAQDALWPADSPKLQIVSGVDILTLKGQEGLEAELKERVKNASKITHVYFFGELIPRKSEVLKMRKLGSVRVA